MTTRALAHLRGSLSALDSEGDFPDPFLPRGLQWLVVRVFGRPIVCAECGRTIFKGVPFVWRGKLWLFGAYERVIRASFVSSEAMEFRHAQLDECPGAERPWVE